MTAYNWNVDADGSWSTGGAWDQKSPPTAGSDVSIGTSNFHTVSYTAAAGTLSINSLSVGGATLFKMTGGALTISSSASLNAGLTLVGSASLSFGSGATASIIGQFTAASTNTISIASGATATFYNNAAAASTAAANVFVVAAGGTLEFAGGTMSLGSGTLAGVGGAQGGTVRLSGGTLDLAANLVSINATFASGASIVSGSKTLTLLAGANFYDSGNWSVQTGSGTTLLKGTTTQAGALALDGGRTLEINAVYNWTGGPIYLGFNPYAGSAGGGTLLIDATGNFNVQANSQIVTASGTGLVNNAGIITGNITGIGTTIGTADIQSALNNTGTINVQKGILRSSGGFTNSGAIGIAAGATFSVNGGTAALSATSTVTGAGTLALDGGLLKVDTGITIAAQVAQQGGQISGSGTLTLSGGFKAVNTGNWEQQSGTGRTVLTGNSLLDGAFTLDGGRTLEVKNVLAWTGSTIYLGFNAFDTTLGGGTVQVDAGGTFAIQSDGQIYANTGATSVTNAGTLSKSVTTGIAHMTVAFSNSGAVSVQTGTLALEGTTSASSGTFAVSSGATLRFATNISTFTAGSIGGAGTTEQTSGTLDFGSANYTVGTIFHQSNGIVQGTGTVSFSGGVNFTDGWDVHLGTGTSLLNGSSTLNGAIGLDGGRVLENKGSTAWTGNAIYLGENPYGSNIGGGTIKNDAGASFNINTDSSIYTVAGVTAFSNAGTVVKSGTNGTTYIQPNFTTSGKLAVQSGTLEFDGSFTNSNGTAGALFVAGGATLLVAAGGSTSAGALNVAGAFTIASQKFSLTAGTVAGPGSVQLITAGILDIGAAAVTISGSLVGRYGTVTGTGTLTVNGGLFQDVSDSFVQTGKGTTLLAGNSTVAGTLYLDGGRTLENKAGFTWTGGGAYLGYNPFATTLGGGSITNDFGASFDIQSDSQFVNEGGATSFTNAGALIRSVGTGVADIGVAFTSTGTVSVQTGTLQFDGPFAATGINGSLSVSTGAKMILNGGGSFSANALAVNGAFVVGGGTFALGAGTMTGTGYFGISSFGGYADVEVGANTVTLTGFAHDGGVLNGTGTVTVTGATVFGSVGALLESGSGTTLLAGTTTSLGNVYLDAGRVLENKGVFSWTAGGFQIGYNPFAATVGNGTIQNDSSGTFSIKSDGSIDAGYGTTQFKNFGTVSKSVATGTTYIGITFINTGTVTVNTGAIQLAGAGNSLSGLMNGAGQLTISNGTGIAGLTLGGPITVTNFSTIDETGTLTIGDAGPAAATVVNANGATYNFDNDAGIAAGTGSTANQFTNNGVLAKIGGTGTSRVAVKYAGSGVVNVQTGTLSFDGGGSVKGDNLSISAGATFGIGGGSFAVTGTYNIGGSTLVSGGIADFSAALLTSFGSLLTISGGALKLGAKATTLAGFAQSGGLLDGTGTVTVNGAANFTGGPDLQSGTGRTVLKGPTTIAGTIQLDGGRVLENKSTVNWTAGTLALGANAYGAPAGGGTIQNDAGATFAIQSDGVIVAGAGTVAFANAGALTKSVTTGTTRFYVPLTGAGTVSVQTGTLSLDGGGSAAGAAFTVAAGATLDFGGGNFVISGSTYNAVGTTSVSGGSLSVTFPVTSFGSLLQISGGKLAINSATAIDNYAQSGGDFYAAGAVTIKGAAAFGGTSVLDGTSGASTVLKGATSVSGVLQLDNNHQLLNQGALTWSGAPSSEIDLGFNAFTGAPVGGGSIVNDTAGSFAIQTDGSIRKGGGSTGFSNLGAVVKSVTGGTTNVYVDFTNSGSVSVQTGILAFKGVLTSTGSLAAAGGTTLELDEGDPVTSNSLAGTLSGPGTIAVATGAWSKVGGALSLTGGGTLSDAGTVNQGGTLSLVGGTLKIVAGGVWNLTGNNGIALASGGNGSIVNAGTLAKTGGAGKATIDVGLTDTGAISVGAGTLGINGATNTIAGAISGAGTISFGGGGSTAINVGTSITAAGWTVTDAGTNATLNLALSYGGTFTVQQGGTVTLASGKVLTLAGSAVFNGATLAGSAGLLTNGVTAINGATTVVNTVPWQNNGTINAAGTLTIGNNVATNTTFKNNAAGIYNLTGNAGIALGAYKASSFQNAGLLEKTGGTGVSRIAIGVASTGTVTVATQTLEFDGTTNSFSGTISGAGTVGFAGGGNSTLASGLNLSVAAISVSGAATKVTLGGSVTYSGSVTTTAGTSILVGGNSLTLKGTTTLAGTISGIAGSNLVLTGSTALNTGIAVKTAVWTIAKGAVVANHASFAYAGSFNDLGGTLTLGGKTLTLNGPGSFASGSVVDGAGGLTTKLALFVSDMTIGGGLNWQTSSSVAQSGTVTVGDASGKSATINNLANGFWNIGADVGIAVVAGGTGTFTNAGVIAKTAGSGTSTIGMALINNNRVNALSGTLDFAGPVTGKGTLNIGNGGTLELDGSVASTQTIVFGAGGGSLALTAPAAKFLAPVSQFGAGDTIDLTGFAFSGGPTLSFVENATNTQGTLTINDGAKTTTLTLLGQFVAAGFQASQDAGGGTAITYTAPAAAHTPQLAAVH